MSDLTLLQQLLSEIDAHIKAGTKADKRRAADKLGRLAAIATTVEFTIAPKILTRFQMLAARVGSALASSGSIGRTRHPTRVVTTVEMRLPSDTAPTWLVSYPFSFEEE